MQVMRKIMRWLLPSKSRQVLEESTKLLTEAADKIDGAPPEVKARAGRIFLEASGPPVNPRISTTTA